MASINIELSHLQQKRFIDYQFTIIPPYECKNSCSWDFDCARIEGFEEPHFCIHPSLAGKTISSISNYASESSNLSYLESSDSIISTEFITILLLVLLFACVLIIAHATWSHCFYQETTKRPLKASQSCPINV